MLNFRVNHLKKIIYLTFKGRFLFNLPRWNKGTAYNEKERNLFELNSLLPQNIESLEDQVDRTYQQYLNVHTNLSKNVFLNALHDRNETVFYKLVMKHLPEMLPILYTPTIGDAVISFSQKYRRNRGLYLNYTQRDQVDQFIKCHLTKETKMVIITDGEGVLGIGDWGVGGMDISIGKLMVYIACSKMNPSFILPICLDVGTNNEKLINDPQYIGWKHPRIREDNYFKFIDTVVESIKSVNPNMYLHFEDFGRSNARRVLDRYQGQGCTFNDDIEGTGLIALATIISAVKQNNQSIKDQRIVILGPGSAGLGVADVLKQVLIDSGLSEAEAKNRLWLVGRYGLLQKKSVRFEDQAVYARDDKVLDKYNESISLLDTINIAKPTILIGCSGAHGAFTEEIVREMKSHVEYPIIMPLSNPITCCEALPKDLLKWCEGKVHIAAGSPFAPVTYQKKSYTIAQCNNAYIFPGLGLGVIACEPRKMSKTMLLAASNALSDTWHKKKDSNSKMLLPPLNESYPEYAYEIAKAVALQAIKEGLSNLKAKDVDDAIHRVSWDVDYYQFEYTKCIDE